MEKRKGATAGILVLAGLLLRPLGFQFQEKGAGDQKGAETTTTEAVKQSTGEGPWIASCQYWAPMREEREEAQPESPVSVKVTEAGKTLDASFRGSGGASDGCPKNRWGLPSDLNNDARITAVIAAVPDPLRAHVALLFDRTIDAYVQAAADNGYVESYYWIPWRTAAEKVKDREGFGAAEDQEAKKREREPGLIVFRQMYPLQSANPGDNFDHVMYLFLVRNTPVLGVDGEELGNAFRYEAELKGLFRGRKGYENVVRLTPRTDSSLKDELAIIGSYTSGAAAPLLKGIQTAHKEVQGLDFKSVRIGGVATTKLASSTFRDADLNMSYLSFAGNDEYEDRQFQHLLTQAGYPLSRVALLVEDGTTYGLASGRTSALGMRDDVVEATYGLCPETQRDVIEIARKEITNEAVDHAVTSDTELFKFVLKIRDLVSQAAAGCSANQPKSQEVIDSISSMLEASLAQLKEDPHPNDKPVLLRFPRGISLLRNAHSQEQVSSSDSGSNQQPYLHLSLRENSIEDMVPRFSTDQTPVSLEAQLMATLRQLHRLRTQFVAIYASDVLDEIYLAQVIHRALPDVRTVNIGGGDLLYERENENVPFVGALTITPYNLVAPVPSFPKSGNLRAYSDAYSQSVYNAASYIFWDGDPGRLRLANYHSILDPNGTWHGSLWAMLSGRDGYYPLGLVDECASDVASILPAFKPAMIDGRQTLEPEPCDSHTVLNRAAQRMPFAVTPPLSWFLCCTVVIVFCIAHLAGFLAADLWSPFTRDLAIDRNDEPCRRAIYIHIGTAMLFCMAVVVGYPILPSLYITRPLWISVIFGVLTMLAGLTAWLWTLIKTWRYIFPKDGPGAGEPNEPAPEGKQDFWHGVRLYRVFHILALLSAIIIPGIWVWNCGPRLGRISDPHYTWIFFSYRSLNPLSGVCPMVPVLLLLGGWYCWSIFQTRRLRFSEASRPRLPEKLEGYEQNLLFISDNKLSGSGLVQRTPLYETITCLLITPEYLGWTFPKTRKYLMAILVTFYAVLFGACLVFGRINSPERLLSSERLTTYELLVQVLFFPLMVITLTGWLRIILIWGNLSRGLLRPLEQAPIRSAFGRLTGFGWMALMRQNGLVQRWREMSRSIEAIRQMHSMHEFDEVFRLPGPDEKEHQSDCRYSILVHHMERLHGLVKLRHACSPGQQRPGESKDAAKEEKWTGQDKRLRDQLRSKRVPTHGQRGSPDFVPGLGKGSDAAECAGGGETNALWDVPEGCHEDEVVLMYLIENDYAAFAQALLQYILIPYWTEKRHDFVESEREQILPVHARRIVKEEDGTNAETVELHVGQSDSNRVIRLAEEFLAIRYVSVIRSVLVNVRHLMSFVSAAFVLTIVSWNSYPFRPRQWVDAALTAMLLVLGGGIIWVFAQIHRDAILSRITRTTPNELGTDFYIRVVAFGAVPVLTWLAYQFPSISGGILRYLQPSIEATMK